MWKIYRFELDAIYINSQASKSHRMFHIYIYGTVSAKMSEFYNIIIL